MKQSYLVVYDYGTGGVWALMCADSRTEIVDRYPVLKVVEKRPPWMNDEEFTRIATQVFDIDDAPPRWLAIAMEEAGSRNPSG